HGMWKNEGELSEAEETFFQVLQKAGYCTAQVGKTHFYEHAEGVDLPQREAYLHGRGLEYVHETAGPNGAKRTPSYLTDEWAKKGLPETFIEDIRAREDSPSGGVWASPLAVDDFLDSMIRASPNSTSLTCPALTSSWDCRNTGHNERPRQRVDGSPPPASTTVGKTSTISAIASLRLFSGILPGQRAMSGMRMLDSWNVDFLSLPWSPSISPWSDRNTMNRSSSHPRRAKASRIWPTLSSMSDIFP